MRFSKGIGPPKKPLSLKSRRRRARALIAAITLLLVGATLWGIHHASYLPRFTIRSIEVEGARAISPEIIRDYTESILNDGRYHLLSRSNIFVYPREELERGVVGYFPRIRSAAFSRDALLSTTLRIEVEERVPYALWCSGEGKCFAMDEGGFIFAEAPAGSATSTGSGQASSSQTTTQYVFEGGVATSSDPVGQTFIKAHLPGLLALLQKLGQSGFDPRGARIEDEQDFSMPLGAGYRLKASFGADASSLAKNLELVLASDTLKERHDRIEYIDLRFGNRVYYKLKGEAEVPAQ